MALFGKKKKVLSDANGALTLRTHDNQPLYTFHEDVINSMRHMITTLLYKNDLPPRIALVSALQGEGVTYTTLALATTLAYDLAVRVCVVELNWWSPSLAAQLAQHLSAAPAAAAPKAQRPKLRIRSLRHLHRMHMTQRASKIAHTSRRIKPPLLAATAHTGGLAAVLQHTATLDHVLVPTALPNLALLPAGELSPAQRPAIARSLALKQAIEQLGQRFDYILLDIPAILTTSDAIALASFGAACCVVVRQGTTPVNNVRRALDDVKHLPILGVVLNQTRAALPRWVSALVPQE